MCLTYLCNNICYKLVFLSPPLSPFYYGRVAIPAISCTPISKPAGELEVGVVEDTEQSCVPMLMPSLAEGGITSSGGFPVAGVTFKESVSSFNGSRLPFPMSLSSDAISFWFACITQSSSRSLDVVSELLSHELVLLRLCPRSSSWKRLQLDELCESESDQLNLRFFTGICSWSWFQRGGTLAIGL